MGQRSVCNSYWKNILNPRRGRTAGNSPNICKTSKGQNKVYVFFSSHQHNFYMFCMDITWNHGVMCKENFVDLWHWHRGWFGPCAGSIRHARSGDVRGRLRWLHSVGLKIYELPALYQFVPTELYKNKFWDVLQERTFGWILHWYTLYSYDNFCL